MLLGAGTEVAAVVLTETSAGLIWPKTIAQEMAINKPKITRNFISEFIFFLFQTKFSITKIKRIL